MSFRNSAITKGMYLSYAIMVTKRVIRLTHVIYFVPSAMGMYVT